MRQRMATWVLAAAAISVAAPVWAASPAEKCEAGKNKVAGKYYFCREKAEAKAIKTGSVPDYSTCTAKFDQKWDQTEARWQGMCPDNVLTAPMNAFIAAQATETAAVIAGSQGIPACGDGLINVAGEQCDGQDLGGESCLSLGFSGGALSCDGACSFDTSGCTLGCGFPATGQTTSYGPGSDGDVQAGAFSYTDNGDGTITDNLTGLMWEKKSDDGSIHDKDNNYTWGMASSPYTMNGTMVTVFLAALNTPPCFAGHCDWRIPNVKELQSLVDYEPGFPGPTVKPAFNTNCTPGCTVTTCSCTASWYYWTSTTWGNGPSAAWLVPFNADSMFMLFKDQARAARAVRGGF